MMLPLIMCSIASLLLLGGALCTLAAIDHPDRNRDLTTQKTVQSQRKGLRNPPGWDMIIPSAGDGTQATPPPHFRRTP